MIGYKLDIFLGHNLILINGANITQSSIYNKHAALQEVFGK